MSEIAMLKKIIRLLLGVIQSTPGGVAQLGKSVMADPEVMLQIAALASKEPT